MIVGGSDAGISAGLRAREIDPGVEPLLIVADAYPNFSICGIPYLVSGEVVDWRHLAHRTRADLEDAGLQLRLDTRAEHIDPSDRTVTVTGPSGLSEEIGYDQLVVATGAVPVLPPMAGLERLGPSDGVHVLHTMGDIFALLDTLGRDASSVVIVGAGYIGLEMAETLTTRGLRVMVVEQLPQVLSTLDADFALLVAAELERHGVQVRTSTVVTEIARGGRGLTVHGHTTTEPASAFTATADVVLVVVGVRPDTALARTAGVNLGVRGAIAVDRYMRTNVSDVYAAGDCVHTFHRVLDANTYLPLGTTAHKQGRVAGANALGVPQMFAGSVGTQVVKVFDLVAARTGLRDTDLATYGLDGVSHQAKVDDHKAYYPGAQPIMIKVTGDPHTGRLLGAQLVGHRDTAVHARVDVYAAALHHRMRVREVSDLDLSYTPPLGSPFDAVQIAADQWVRGRYQPAHADQYPSRSSAAR